MSVEARKRLAWMLRRIHPPERNPRRDGFMLNATVHTLMLYDERGVECGVTWADIRRWALMLEGAAPGWLGRLEAEMSRAGYRRDAPDLVRLRELMREGECRI